MTNQYAFMLSEFSNIDTDNAGLLIMFLCLDLHVGNVFIGFYIHESVMLGCILSSTCD